MFALQKRRERIMSTECTCVYLDNTVGAPSDEEEIWRSIRIDKHCLYVSSLGRIMDEEGNEMPVSLISKSDYLSIYAHVSQEFYKRYSVHRLVARAFYPVEMAILAEPSIHHINGNRYDNRAENLKCMETFDHSRLHENEQKKANAELLQEKNTTKMQPLLIKPGELKTVNRSRRTVLSTQTKRAEQLGQPGRKKREKQPRNRLIKKQLEQEWSEICDHEDLF
jgi:hypothetical protein